MCTRSIISDKLRPPDLGQPYLSASLVHIVAGPESVQMVDAGVHANLVQDSDTSRNDFGFKGLHGIRHVAGCDDVLVIPNGRLDDIDVEGVGNERDDQVMPSYEGVKCSVVFDVQSNGFGQSGKLLRKTLSIGEAARS